MMPYFYDIEASRRQKAFVSQPEMRRQREIVRDMLDPRRGEKILDIGSGTGELAHELAGQIGNGAIIGLDVSYEMNRLACAANQGRRNVHFVRGDASELPFPDASFEAVTSIQCMSYVQDIKLAFREISRVLKEQGRLLILDTDWDHWEWNCDQPHLMRRVMTSYRKIYADPHLPKCLPQLLARSGFRITRQASLPIVNRDYRPGNYAGMQFDFIRFLNRKKRFLTVAEFEAWSDGLQSARQSGNAYFKITRRIFLAQKSF